MTTTKRRKVFPFYEHHGNLVYIGGVQRKLRPEEEAKLFRVLLNRKFVLLIKATKKLSKLFAQLSTAEQQKLLNQTNIDKAGE